MVKLSRFFQLYVTLFALKVYELECLSLPSSKLLQLLSVKFYAVSRLGVSVDSLYLTQIFQISLLFMIFGKIVTII